MKRICRKFAHLLAQHGFGRLHVLFAWHLFLVLLIGLIINPSLHMKTQV